MEEPGAGCTNGLQPVPGEKDRKMPIEVTLSKTVTNREIADAFVGASEQDQCEILCEMLENIRGWQSPFSWPMQCRHITNRLGDDYRRPAVTQMLRDLVDHLEDGPLTGGTP